jgi:diguanylate cyclase (GGDEF)-like protein
MKRSTLASILVVDDTPANLRLLTKMLSDRGYHVHVARSGQHALQSVREHPPTLILLDILMPGMDGLEVCRQLKSLPVSRDIPIVFLTAVDSMGAKSRAFDQGGVDYITKPFELFEVLARVDTHVRMRRLQLLLQAQNRELQRLATSDPLTGLMNRRSFQEHARLRLEESERYGIPCCLGICDIDRFKPINDRYGHDVGDRVLRGIAQRLAERIRGADLIARWGGEEFTLLLPSTPVGAGEILIDQLRKLIGDSPFPPVGLVTASFGLTEFTAGDDLDSLLKRADRALYAAKRSGRHRVEIVLAGDRDPVDGAA